jgi:hypothetical protein
MIKFAPTKDELKSRAPIYIGGAIAVAGLVYSTLSNTPKIETIQVTKFVQVVQEKEVIRYVEVEKKTNTHTEITKPDGTKIVTTRTTEEEVKDSTKEREDTKIVAKEESTKKTEPKQDRYHLGLNYNLDKEVSATVGVRLGNLPLFLTATVTPVPFNLGLGLSYYF